MKPTTDVILALSTRLPELTLSLKDRKEVSSGQGHTLESDNNEKTVTVPHSRAKVLLSKSGGDKLEDDSSLRGERDSLPKKKKRPILTAKCEYCDKVLSSKWALKDHIKLLHLKECEQCQDCGKSFHSRYLKHHRDAVHLKKRINCQECGMSFSFSRSLKKHIQVVHNNMRKRNLVECDLCQKSLNKDSMKKHKAMHRRIFIKALRVDS